MEKFTKWRKALKTGTLEEAAKLLGVSAVQVWRLEKGTRKIPAEKVTDYSEVTGISRHELRPDIFEKEPA